MNDFPEPTDRTSAGDRYDWVPQSDDGAPPAYRALTDATAPAPGKRRKSLGIKMALVGAGVAAGAVAATAIGANAQSESGSPANVPAAAATTTPTGAAQPGDRDHGSGGGHAGEQALSAALTAKLKAAALKAVPGATVDRVETDSGDATYEAHMTKSNGTKVTVKFDKTGKVTAVEAGMGK